MKEEIKKKIDLLKGKKIRIKVDIGRNKKEIYEGFIVDTYSNVWIFKTKEMIKSFNYSDILTKQVIISS